MMNSKHILLLLTACTWVPSAFAMKSEKSDRDYSINVTPVHATAKAREMALYCLEEVQKRHRHYSKELPSHGIIVVRTPVPENVGVELQVQLQHHLELSREEHIERSTASQLAQSNFQPWQRSFIEKLNLKSLQNCPDKSIIFGAFPKGTPHLPLVTAEALLQAKRCWLVVQQQETFDKCEKDLFTSGDDQSFVAAEITYGDVAE